MKSLFTFSAIAFLLSETALINKTGAQENTLRKVSANQGMYFIKGINIKDAGEPLIIFSTHRILSLNSETAKKINYIETVFEDTLNPFSFVGCVNGEEKNYVQWMVENDKKNGIFIIERSINSTNFTVVGFKNRIGSVIPKLSYYFTDNDIPCGIVYYRVLAMGEDGSYKYSDTLKVENIDLKRQALY